MNLIEKLRHDVQRREAAVEFHSRHGNTRLLKREIRALKQAKAWLAEALELQRPAGEAPYAQVICRGELLEGDPGCGRQSLTRAQYEQQLFQFDKSWSCPRCGNSADFDDAYFEETQHAH